MMGPLWLLLCACLVRTSGGFSAVPSSGPPFALFPSFRVSNLATSVAFYENVLGAKRVVGGGPQQQQQHQSASVAHLSFGGGNGIELSEAAAGMGIDRGSVFQGIGVTMPDAASIVRTAEKFGGKIVRAFDEYGYGASIIPDEDEMKINPVRLGCIADPDGYCVEVTEGSRAEPLRKVVLHVLDTEEAVAFYGETLGMRLLRRRSNINSRPKHASICSFVSHEDSELEGTMLELVYNYAVDRLQVGTGVAHLGMSSSKVPAGKMQTKDPNNLPIVVY